MSWCSREPLRVTAEVTEWLHYHGTRADLQTGDLIKPGYVSNYGATARTARLSVLRIGFPPSLRRSSAAFEVVLPREHELE